jgi:uncharacterized membrane protein/mono/diheme cytochrome c family protein
MLMMILSVADVIGRFHPVLVHLPIGILILACIFQWLSLKKKFIGLQAAIPLMFLWGGITAVFSCITGYLLSQSADYSMQLVNRHQWLGISTAAIALGIYFFYRKNFSRKILSYGTVLLFGLITITGHLGGSLTHGEDYLTELWQGGAAKPVALAPVPNIQEAVAYKDVITPIFEARCISCHGATKQKGKLRLDSRSGIEKGGEDGLVLVAGKPEESEIIKRLLLSMDAKKHMPPINKAQLSAEEIAVLHWWIGKGADFTVQVKNIEQPAKIKPALLAMQSGKYGVTATQVADVPAALVAAGDKASITALQQAGVTVIPVAQNSNYLSVNFISAMAVNDQLIRQLLPLANQLIWLKMDGLKLSDSAIAVLVECKQLRRIFLNNSTITDLQLQKFTSLVNLQSMQLVGTPVTVKGLAALTPLKQLKHIFIYKTAIAPADLAALQKTLKGIQIDTGNYKVPTLPTDTVIVTEPQAP